MAISAGAQLKPSMKKRWTETEEVAEVLVILIRVFSAAGLVAFDE
jgi:hypothetical protein